MKTNNKILIFGLIIVLFASVTATFYLAKQKLALSQLNSVPPPPTPTLSVTLTAGPPKANMGDKLSVNVSVAGDSAASLSAADLKLSYPPSSLKFINSQPGNIWTKAVKLKQEVNSETGIINLSLGKGIGAENTPNLTLATFEFQVISSSPGVVKLELNDSTRFAQLGSGSQPVSYRARPLNITTN